MADEFVPIDGLLHVMGIKYGYSYLTGEDGVHPIVDGYEKIVDKRLRIIEN